MLIQCFQFQATGIVRTRQNKMMSFLLLFIAQCIFSSVTSNFIRVGHEYDEAKSAYISAISKAHIYHDIVIAIKQDNIEYLKYMLMQIADPTDGFYGQYLTREEVGQITANRQSSNAVVHYLSLKGVDIIRETPYGEYITCRASLEKWESIFQTTFYQLNLLDRKIDANQFYRAIEYKIPDEISRHVIDNFNTIQIPPENIMGRVLLRPHKHRNNETVKPNQPTTITPTILNSYYNIDSNLGHPLASQSVFESLGQYYSNEDVSQFQDEYDILRTEVAHSYGMHESAVFCQFVPTQCAEANLDVQYLMAISQQTPTTIWYQPPIGDDIFLAWIQAVASDPSPPLVHSISYGALEKILPLSYAKAFNNEAIKLAVQGVTIVASSGDDGVANFRARSSSSECGYNPTWPASSAYVLSVGASQGPEVGEDEIACGSDSGGDITTGGGFSTLFSAEEYQKKAISGYFKSLSGESVPKGGFEAGGRAYPDIAVAGHNYEVIIGGNTYLASGTSASAPVITGMISLLNSARMREGKPPVGFINIALYQTAASFVKDITTGKNSCTASSICCSEGFTASKGWDPLTGLGSVDFKKMKETFLAFE